MLYSSYMPLKFPQPKIIILVIFLGFFLLPFFVSAAAADEQNFFIDKGYDRLGREVLESRLLKIGKDAYYYGDKEWWDKLSESERAEVSIALTNLDWEFANRIRPTLTSVFGDEWRPGIDTDTRVTVLLHSMKENAGGYTNYGDEYLRVQNPSSNEREMVYLNTYFLGSPNLKSFLAHEFLHLITFNQKERLQRVSEEVWLNEARAEYAPTILGYDDDYEGSNLQRRVKAFLKSPGDALLEWNNEAADYGVASMFIQYLVDQYGLAILKDSLQSSRVGVASLQDALAKNGFSVTFEKVFQDWTIAVFLNDCTIGERYCYRINQLKEVRIAPQLHFLPITGDSKLTTANNARSWAGNWYKIIGGKDILKVDFTGDARARLEIPYILQGKEEKSSVHFLVLEDFERGTLYIPGFNSKNLSLTLIPLVRAEGSEQKSYPTYQFVFTIGTTERTPEQEQVLIAQLLAQIDSLKKKIAELQLELARVLASQGGVSCSQLTRDLSFGMRGDREVSCLQELLKTKEPGLYPEGLVTGNFFSLTQAAVIKFQEKYAQEILAPIGLFQGTGYVGSLSRKKLNQLF